MAREDFILSVRIAAKELHPLDVWTDSPQVKVDKLAATLAAADLWLTRKSVEGFSPTDFPDLPAEGLGELQREVDEFLKVANGVPPAGPATRKQVREVRPHLERIAAILGGLTKAEWLPALDRLAEDAESWARKQDWTVKRESKTIREPLLEEYAAPRLLIHSPNGRLLLDPVKAFWTGENGLVEFCVLPSYDSAKIIREHGEWRVHPLRPNGRALRWSEDTFVKTARQLLESA